MGRNKTTGLNSFLNQKFIQIFKNRKKLKSKYNKKLSSKPRLGFTLLEVSLAIVIVSVVMITAITATISALDWHIEADKLAVAMALSQTKLAEIRATNDLGERDESGEDTDEDSLYFGYQWQTSISEENLDIGEILENSFGDLDIGLQLGDQLPAGIQNATTGDDTAAKKGLFSLGEIPILKITVTIKYPQGSGSGPARSYGTYHVESIQRSKRSSLYQRQ